MKKTKCRNHKYRKYKIQKIQLGKLSVLSAFCNLTMFPQFVHMLFSLWGGFVHFRLYLLDFLCLFLHLLWGFFHTLCALLDISCIFYVKHTSFCTPFVQMFWYFCALFVYILCNVWEHVCPYRTPLSPLGTFHAYFMSLSWTFDAHFVNLS